LAKPNYRQQKRQKELSRKSRQAEKLQRRTGKLEGEEGNAPLDAPASTGGAAAVAGTVPGPAPSGNAPAAATNPKAPS